MKRKILYLINPVSGTNSKSGVKKLIEKKTAEKGLSFTISLTERNGNYASVVSLIEAEEITDVVICGGDGSINTVVSALRHLPLRFGIIPAGSGNGLALAACIPARMEKALELILENKHSEPVDAFHINGKFSCMLSGLGLDAMVAKEFASSKRRGFLTYLIKTVSSYIKCKPYRFSINADGKTIDAKAFFISIANSNQFGNHFTIAPKASLSDGLLDLVIVNHTEKLMLIWNILRHIKSGKISDEGKTKNGVQYLQSREILIHNIDGAPLHIDGDPSVTSDKIEVRVIPAAFHLIKP